MRDALRAGACSRAAAGAALNAARDIVVLAAPRRHHGVAARLLRRTLLTVALVVHTALPTGANAQGHGATGPVVRWPAFARTLPSAANRFATVDTGGQIPSAVLPEGIPDFSLDATRPSVQSVQTGRWSSPATWQGGQVPTANHIVRVAAGHVVTIDDTNAVAYTTVVDGKLTFSTFVNTRLTVTNLEVMAGSDGMGSPGILEVGTQTAPVAAGVAAEIVIADSPLGGGVADPDQFGTGIQVFGSISLHGSVKTPTFVRVAAEPLAGHTTLTLAEAVTGWRVGDRLVLPDTRHIAESETVPGGWTNLVNQWEERTIQAISADGLTISLDTALQFNHLGARDLNNVLAFLPHVGNLTRNVIVRSQRANGTRGHAIFTHMASVDIRYAAFKDLGRTTYLPLDNATNHIGRYPIHFHHLSGPVPTPANGYQFTLVGNAVDGGSVETRFKWGVAVHGSHYGSIKDNVVYNYNGASFATEDGSESFNEFDHNFAIRGMGQPNDILGEARMAMGTEGVGFWFRGPNNFVTNNVAANFQNSTSEAAYGFAYQFRLLGEIQVPKFKGAHAMGAPDPAQFTTMNGNNMPLLQFENNEAYGAMQGGFTYWWINTQDPEPFATAQESLIKNLKIWHVYNKAVYLYPGQNVTFDGLAILGTNSADARCCGNGVYAADYSSKGIVIKNSDIQGMLSGITAPMSGFGPEPNLIVQDTHLRNRRNLDVPTVGSVNGCWMPDKLVVSKNNRFEAAPGWPLLNVAMVRDVAHAGECLTKLDQTLVYVYNGNPADNFQVFHTDPLVLPRPPATCTPTTRPEINGLLCPIAPIGPVPPTASLSAVPGSITIGQSASLTWSTENTDTVTIDQGIGAVQPSGTRSVSPTADTTYTVTATNADGTATASVTIEVHPPVAPTITWSAPAAITSLTPLGASQLNATTTVPGTFEYSPRAGTVLGVGASWQLSVTFTPADLTTYAVATASVPLTVTRAKPVVTWPVPAAIVYPTALGAAQLNAVGNVQGSFSYTPPAGTVPPSGTRTLSVTFTPTDAANYDPVTTTVPLTVVKGNPTIVWATPATVTYPVVLGPSQLNATVAGTSGSLAYVPLPGTPLPAGTHSLSVTFTPTDASYAVSTKTVSLTVSKATPNITWLPPASIVSGTALGSAQLNATAAHPATGLPLPGSFAYNPTAGALLAVGPAQRLTATFTPGDSNFATVTATVPITVTNAATGGVPTPRLIGNAGTFNDATGHSGQSHMVYAPNSGVWWLFTLTSAHDTFGDQTVQAYRSSGPDLTTASWTAANSSPDVGHPQSSTAKLAGGRSLGVALRTIGTTDYVHLFVSAATDGQTSSNGHMRAQLNPTSIAWGTWNNPGSPNTASEWDGPLGTGNSGAAFKSSWGNSVGVSTGGYIHHFSVTMDQEVDCAVGRSTNPDTAATWVNGFGNNVSPTGNSGTSPPWTVAVIDKSMTFQCKALAFAPLAADAMLAVYSNGSVAQPNMTNLRFKRSGTGATAGTWTNIAANGGGGDGSVFGSNANINHDDWALIPVTTTRIYAFRRNAAGTAIEGASYTTGNNRWTALSPAPPIFGAGQAFKVGPANSPVSAGLFGATDGTNVWLFVINNDSANSILYTKFDGASWTPWTPVPGTTAGTQTRNFIAGYPTVSNNQIGLAWTQGTTTFDVYATSLALSTGSSVPPATAVLTAPLTGSTLSAATTVSATATPGLGAAAISGVQFFLDGLPLGAEDTTSPYSVVWNTATASNGAHFLAAVARDSNGGTGASLTSTVTVINDQLAPTVAMTGPAAGSVVPVGTNIPLSADASDDVGVVGVQFLLDGVALGAEILTPPYTLLWSTADVPGGTHAVAARARDASGKQATSTSVTMALKAAPAITWPAPVAIAYGTPLGATQLNASTPVPGTFAYTPPAGTMLLAGTQTLSAAFTPTDTLANAIATASVTITVIDSAPPTVFGPSNAVLEATGPAGAIAFFTATATDPVDGSVPVNCSPQSGATFPLGVTTVTCTATDLNGNSRSSSFTVTVRDTMPPVVTAPAALSVPATEIGGARGNVARSLGSQALATFLAGASAVDRFGVSIVAPQAPRAVIDGVTMTVDVTTLFPPGVTVVTFAFRDASGNEGTAFSTVTVTARTADEPTIVNTTATGGARLKSLQLPDGGWNFKVGANVCGGSCPNTIGTTALGLLAAYVRSHDQTMLTAAERAGDLLVSRYDIAKAQTPPGLPVNRDIEFLVALAQLTGKQVYATTARSWFQLAVDRFPNAADQIDDMIARRDSQKVRSVAAWDAASYIRAAKAVGLTNRAVAAAVRIRDREPDWKDTNPLHRFDQCANPSGCGPVGNALAFDYTLLGEGSLLWAIHDLPGFDAQIAEYRTFLVAQQDPEGSWDVGDAQMTSFIVMGLAAVGGPGANAAIASAARFFLANQLPDGGWPAIASAGFIGPEYAEVNGEIVRAIATLFSTPAGASVSVVPSQLSTVTFSNVTTSGITTVIAVDQTTVPNITGGFEVVGNLTYQVATTATISGDITVCFSVQTVDDPEQFALLRIMHGENGVLVDRTILAPDEPAPDFATRRLCARTASLSPFAVAIALPDITAPTLQVPANAVVEAAGAEGGPYAFTVSATDDVDSSVTASCLPASGSTFPIGVTTVRCTATDAHGNAGASTFTVTVGDTTAPVISVPPNDTQVATSATGLIYTYTTSAADAVSGTVATTCAPTSGALFPVGTTTVACTASDAVGNVASGSFSVTVTAPPKNVAPIAYAAEYTTASNVPFIGQLKATDANDDALTFFVVLRPSKGRLVVDAQTGAFTFTPDRRSSGSDKFMFVVSDGRALSNVVIVRLRVGG